MIGYNISAYTNEYLDQKLANLSNSKIYKNYSTYLHICICIFVISFSITFYYILKARKMKLSSKQKFELYIREKKLYISIVFNTISTLLYTFLSGALVPCNVEEGLKKFKM